MRTGSIDNASQHPIASLRPTLEKELAGIIDRLISGAVVEAETAVERARAAGQFELDAAEAALEEQTRRSAGLTESLLQGEIQVEELRTKLEVEREQTKAVREAYENERSARVGAEAANDEAKTAREQIVSAYESQLHTARETCEAMRAELTGVKQQLEIEVAERARLSAALRTVQEACAFVGADTPAFRAPIEKSHKITSNTQGLRSQLTADEIGAGNEGTEAANDMDDEGTLAPTTSGGLKLVTLREAAPVAPPQLLQYFKQLFEQIEAVYSVDQQTHASIDVVDRLSANLRYAREVFVQRAASQGVIGATLFEQELCAKLDEFGDASFGRHLSIAAYELTQPVTSPSFSSGSV
ncbi:MAG: hypothetical protein ABIR92_09385 [Gemmatimonadaceae bacterium]